MAAVTFDDLDPQDTDSVLILKQKRILTIRASAKEILGGNGDTDIDPDDGDSWTILDRKELEAERELQAAIEAA